MGTIRPDKCSRRTKSRISPMSESTGSYALVYTRVESAPKSIKPSLDSSHKLIMKTKFAQSPRYQRDGADVEEQYLNLNQLN